MLAKFPFLFAIQVLALTLLVGVTGPARAAVAGHFEFVSGNVRIVTPNEPARIARKGDEVSAGDLIVTGSGGVGQLIMVDGGRLSVRPHTRLRIDAYRYKQPGKENRSFFSLLAGAFRSITGLIGKTNHKDFRVSTETATIGIRGSDGEIGYDPARKLTAVRTYSGAYTLTARNKEGKLVTLEITAGQIAQAIQGQTPGYVKAFPFTNGGTANNGGTSGAASSTSNGTGSAAESENGQNGGETLQVVSISPQTATVATCVSNCTSPVSSPQTAPLGSGGVGGDLYYDATLSPPFDGGSGVIVLDGTAGKAITLGSQGEVTLVTAPPDQSGGGFEFANGNGVLARSGTFQIPDSTGGVASSGSWGIWQGDFVLVDSGVLRSPIGGFPYAYGTNVTTPSQLVALGNAASPVYFSYHQIGGTATNEVGALASSWVVNVSGDFDGSSTYGTVGVGVQADFPTGSTNWSGGFSGTIADMMAGHNGGLTGGMTCSICYAATGKAHGLFLGKKAEGVMVSVFAADVSYQAAVQGTTAALLGTAVGTR